IATVSNLTASVVFTLTVNRRLPVIQAVAVEVRQTTPSLLSQLLQKLRSNIQLLECLLIIGYLRRIGVFGEYEMRLQLVLDSHRWVPLPAVGFSATSISSILSYGTAPVAVLINSVSVALTELRACALVSLKKVLAQELIKGLHLDAQRKRVAFPHSATCFGRCYPGGAALIMDAKNLYDGFGRLSTIASLKEPSKPVRNVEEKTTSENGDFRQAVMENGVEPTGTIDETRISNADEKEIEQSHFAD
ncbi:hypothetical protein Gorai_011078, partial [Gossypium raimondii]|nr:hypothetical protein [Gossypium raimondii]